jgi:hypothetical protein
VTLSTPPDGGTTAEVYLPASLISLDTEPAGWRRRAAEAPLASVSEKADAGVADLPFSVLRFASGPEPPLGPGADVPEPPLGPESGVPEAVPVLLGAPVPSPAPGTSTDVIEPEPVDADPADGPPIFESVRSGHVLAFGRDLLRFSDQAGQPSAGRPARPPASWGDGNGRAVATPPAESPAASRPTLSEPPQRVPPPERIRGAAVDQETGQDSAVESAEIAWRQLASFQRGSRRARTAARMNRSAKQPGQDG